MKKEIAKKQAPAALTLVEMLVAMIMVTIVLSAAAVTMIYGQRSLDHEWQQVGIQREASYAMLKMKQTIRSASQAQITGNGKGFKVYKDNQWIKFKYVSGAKDIRYKVLGGGEEWEDYDIEDPEANTLINGIVESAYFSIDPSTNSTVTISFYLKNGQYEAQVSSSVTMRNFVTGSGS
jgi:type II secretory pathway pseudopilin PulG